MSSWRLSARNREGGRAQKLLLCGCGRDWSCLCISEAGLQVQGNCCFSQGSFFSPSQGTLVLRLCPSRGFSPLNMTSFKDFTHFPGLTVTFLRIYMSFMTIIIFSFLISLCCCPVLIRHINVNCKNAMVQCWSVYSSLMLEQVHRPSPDCSPVFQ